MIKCEFDQAQILINRGSRYGPVILAVKSKVKNLFSGGSLLATSEDKAATEEFINSSLLAASVQTEKDILFIGTAVSGQIEEISQYRLNSLDCLQINPLLWQFVPSFSTHRLDKRMRFITGDPRSYLKTTAKRYDAILMNMPAPATLALNRYFTLEFFQLVGRCLKPDGIFSFSIPSKREILSPQFAKFNSSIINSLEKVFPKKLIIPSDTMIIIASLKKDIAAQDLIDNFSIIKPPTEFLTIYHLRDNLEPRIRDYVQSRLDKNIAPNLDLYPSGFLHYLALEQLKFYPRLNLNLENIRKCIIILLILGGLGIILCVHMPKIMALINIGAIGFTSISLSSILFIIFQLYGAALFWKLGLLIAFFMAGTAAGTWVVGKIKNLRPAFLVWVYLSWMAAALLLLAGLKRLNTINDASLILYCLALSCGMLTGSSYPLQAKNLTKNGLVNRKVPGIIYAADLGGAFLGALASGIFLIPFLGIPESLFALALLNAIMALVNLRR